MLATFINFLLNIFSSSGYFGVFILMMVESSFIPFPSEIVVPPAAYLASQGELNIFLVILASVIGSLLGALINYCLSLSLGRVVIYRLAKTKLAHLIGLSEERIKKSEEYFLQHGERSTFVGRLLPVIRQLISIPAGLAKMNLSRFILFTTLGSLLWTIILAMAGYLWGENSTIISQYYRELTHIFLVILAIYIIYRFLKYLRKRRQSLIFPPKSNIVNK
jgi:membrane protein DedA with SNARE-associated domain